MHRSCAISLPLPESGKATTWGNLQGGSAALALLSAYREHDGALLVVCRDIPQMQRFAAELRFYGGSELGGHVHLFPHGETLPYDTFAPHADLVNQRLTTLYHLHNGGGGILLAPWAALSQALPPAEFLDRFALWIRVGDTLDPVSFRERLDRAGYQAVSQVKEPGEFAIRGSIVDLFPAGTEQPIRIDLFDEEIDSLRYFDPETQLTTGQVEEVRLLPAREVPLDDEGIQHFRSAFRARFEGDPHNIPLYRDVSQGLAPGGIEYYLPLFFERTATLADYLPRSALVALPSGREDIAREWDSEVRERFTIRSKDPLRPVLPPEELFLDAEAVEARLSQLTRVELSPEPAGDPGLDAPVEAPHAFPAARERHAAIDELARFLAEHGDTPTLLVAESAGRRETLRELLGERHLIPHEVADWDEFCSRSDNLALTVGSLEHGLVLRDPAVRVIPEAQVFGGRAPRPEARKRQRDPEAVIRNLGELEIGSPVVHEDHGVGRYQGLTRLPSGEGYDSDYLVLEYAGGDKLYVPVDALDRISRYTGSAEEEAPLHKLGGDQWRRAKARAKKKARDTAAELLELYAKRAAKEGYAFPAPDSAYHEFAADFPFEETPDQEKAIEEVLGSMQALQPMDRLVCGDVGFGKTEVAMRAAFLAVQAGKQVLLLTPTTLLAQQHHDSLRDRFANHPVRIELLSRMQSTKEVNQALEGIREGKVDIAVGTHRLLQKDVRFNDLGLVVLDEEHRFGVRQKERLKRWRAEVDMLTLTATPIPRTLNQTMAGIRDISIIATPPDERLAVRTFVSEWDEGLIREAILREIRRGGQVYFLHNEVRTIERTREQLEKLVPEATMRVAHGQLRERELEDVMSDFYHQRFNVLVTTTIIESGIDIPSANTIIINRADRFGLAQLHQLRGRVGRSSHRAYAYLLVNSRQGLTADAEKRLETIESLEDLGVGFLIANHDLEIRGAGEILGEEQSGHIDAVGFETYVELLNEAIEDLKAGRGVDVDTELEEEDHGIQVNLHLPTLIPEDYLPDVHERLVLYKRIASAPDRETLQALREEVVDRFGRLPDSTSHLLEVAQLKLQARSLGIERLEAGPVGGRVVFSHRPRVGPERLVSLLQEDPQRYALHGDRELRVKADWSESSARIEGVRQLLALLASDHAAPETPTTASQTD
ncbi:transcription-repair coupling factor [Thiohalorhabdus denitrificans]|uniref:Transcription-repair-coupling factor n=1 Tax=Thiohalorhabdus denitrificans TaxID=381306 RepID=A0A1G5DGH7_9GAMM|nr:transcription-repair coupling factor [Thiohalorhabdus denitrificans]SCY13843.1 transcription-repair coupling factor [Thiohalorhabdus denitrificans]